MYLWWLNVSCEVSIYMQCALYGMPCCKCKWGIYNTGPLFWHFKDYKWFESFLCMREAVAVWHFQSLNNNNCEPKESHQLYTALNRNPFLHFFTYSQSFPRIPQGTTSTSKNTYKKSRNKLSLNAQCLSWQKITEIPREEPRKLKEKMFQYFFIRTHSVTTFNEVIEMLIDQCWCLKI